MRELVVLGTASQVPTRDRNHGALFLRWDGEGILFDPGEGTQRQLVRAGIASSAITRICITHFHGDHCLGLPGVLQRCGIDRVTHPVDLYFPASGAGFVQRLRHSSIAFQGVDLRLHPVDEGVVVRPPPFTLSARRVEHRVDTVGWRIEEPSGHRMLPDRLAAHGVRGPDISRLQQSGSIDVDGRRVEIEDVSEPRPGQVVSVVLDTRPCPAAVDLARSADLLVCESTYLESEADLARDYFHMTAAQAARLAADAGAGRLVLTHYSARHPDEAVFEAEARTIFANTTAAQDLDRFPITRS